MRKVTIGAVLLTTVATGAFADATWPKNVQFSDDFYKAFKSTAQYERHDVDRGTTVSVAFCVAGQHLPAHDQFLDDYPLAWQTPLYN